MASMYQHGLVAVFSAQRAAEITRWVHTLLKVLRSFSQASEDAPRSLNPSDALPQQSSEEVLEFPRSTFKREVD